MIVAVDPNTLLLPSPVSRASQLLAQGHNTLLPHGYNTLPPGRPREATVPCNCHHKDGVPHHWRLWYVATIHTRKQCLATGRARS